MVTVVAVTWLAVTVPFIKRRVTRRLKTTVQEHDKVLQRITNAFTAWFEERLRDGEADRDGMQHISFNSTEG